MFLLIGVRSGMLFFNKNIGTLGMKQTSGLARGRHSWHDGGVAEGNWIHEDIANAHTPDKTAKLQWHFSVN